MACSNAFCDEYTSNCIRRYFGQLCSSEQRKFSTSQRIVSEFTHYFQRCVNLGPNDFMSSIQFLSNENKNRKKNKYARSICNGIFVVNASDQKTRQILNQRTHLIESSQTKTLQTRNVASNF